MKVDYLSYPLGERNEKKSQVIAMGFFDGVHLGHQKVINKAKKIAMQKKLPLAVLTYDHHPSLVYKKLDGNAKRYLTPLDRKLQLFNQLGVDNVYVVNYNFAFQDQQPQEFVDNYLVGLKADTVVAGFDHTYGKKDAGMTELPGYANGRFDVISVGADELDDQKVSSTRIRRNLDQGHIQTVNRLLGYEFENDGVVVHGLARGRELGFPTANIEYSDKQRLPKLGVYVVEIKVNDIWYKAMASIGKNATFGDNNPVTLEINILDFDQNIYGNRVKVRWLSKMRDEVKYQGPEPLIDQLKIDENNTRLYFKERKNQ